MSVIVIFICQLSDLFTNSTIRARHAEQLSSAEILPRFGSIFGSTKETTKDTKQ